MMISYLPDNIVRALQTVLGENSPISLHAPSFAENEKKCKTLKIVDIVKKFHSQDKVNAHW